MTREEVSKRIRESPFANFLLILPTGHGKTYQALTIIDQFILDPKPILIVIPRLVLIDSWKEEFTKFGFSHYLPYVTFTTYNSLHKHVDKDWFITIYDECHHLSERCREIASNINSKHTCFLSATVKPELQFWIECEFPVIETYTNPVTNFQVGDETTSH